MEITKHTPRIEIYKVALEKNLIPKMDGEIKEIFELMCHTPIYQCTDIELHNAINDGIAKANIIMGLNQKGEAEEAVNERLVMIKMVAEDFRKHWGSLSIKEVVYFFQQFAKGFLGEYRHITHANIVVAMMRYWGKQERSSAVKAWFSVQDKVTNPQVILSDEDKDKIFKDKLIQRFNNFAQSVKINPKTQVVSNGFVDYDYLDQKKIIVFDKATKEKYWKEAIEYVDSIKRDNAIPDKASYFTKMVVELASKDNQGYTITIAKEMLLCDAYKKLINQGKSIEDLL